MLKDIDNNNSKTILFVTNNIQHYQQQFNDYNINDYKIIFVNWNDILSFRDFEKDIKSKNLELIILDMSTTTATSAEIAIENGKNNNQIPNTLIREIKKILPYKRIFFILPSESMVKRFVSFGISNKEDIRIHPFSVFDLIDLISTIKKKGELERLQLHDHNIHSYSSIDEMIKDAIKFLKIGIKNNETTLLLLDKNIDLSDFKYQMASHHGLDANKLQKEGLLKIIYSEEWYFSINQIQKNNDNYKNIVTIDGEKVYRKYFDLIDQVINKEGKKGLRVFGMMDSFFEHGLVDELIDYECMQASKFNEPMVSICVYSDKNIEQLSENQIRRLVLTHKSVML